MCAIFFPDRNLKSKHQSLRAGVCHQMTLHYFTSPWHSYIFHKADIQAKCDNKTPSLTLMNRLTLMNALIGHEGEWMFKSLLSLNFMSYLFTFSYDVYMEWFFHLVSLSKSMLYYFYFKLGYDCKIIQNFLSHRVDALCFSAYVSCFGIHFFKLTFHNSLFIFIYLFVFQMQALALSD